MANDIVRPKAAAAIPDYFDVINALLDIKGAIQLCQQAAANDTSGSESIQAIDGTLTLAQTAVEKLYHQLETSESLREGWVDISEGRVAQA
jgi:hypothetical protein